MSDDHLDAETLAAWVDGGLDAKAAAMVETHVSNCDRCQEIVALILTTESREPAVGNREPWFGWLRAGWLIPLTAGVAAVGLWMIVPSTQVSQPAQAPPAATSIARDEAPQAKAAPFAEPSAAPELKRRQAPADFKQDADRSKNKEEKLADKQDARVDRLEERARVAQPAAAAAPAPPMAPPPPPPAPAAAPMPARETPAIANAQTLGRMAKDLSNEIVSPAARTRWRLVDAGTVEYSRDNGATWETVSTGVNQPLTAGSSPTADVCWLVGKSGTVLLTTDGRRWQRLAFPEPLELTSITATDARSAQVTVADGRLFRTTDAGATWKRD